MTMIALLLALLATLLRLGFAQQYAGDTIPNSLPSTPGAEIAYFRVPDPSGKNNNLTLINYYSLSKNGQRLDESRIQRAVIMVHGLARDPGTYESNILNALSQVSDPNINPDTVAVLAPFFANGDDKNTGYPWTENLPAGQGSTSNALVWPGSQWSAGGNNQYPHNSRNTSSYFVLDSLVQYFDNKTIFPNMNQIVVAGHSLGAQAIQRYAAIGAQLNTISPVTHWVANPNSFVWLSTDRPFDTSACPTYDNYREGFNNFTEYPMKYAVNLVAQGRSAILDNFNSKQIAYARGLQDFGNGATGCAPMTQGAERDERFFEFIKAFPPTCSDPSGRNCDTVDYINTGHDGGAMAASTAGQIRLFTDNFYGDGNRSYDVWYPRQQAGDDPYPNPSLDTMPADSNNNTYAGDMKYFGCFSDQEPRTLIFAAYDLQNNTIEQCTNVCNSNNYSIAGVEFGSQCFCGNVLTSKAQKVVELSCGTTCAGNASQTCGGNNRMSIFSRGTPAQLAPPENPESVGSFYFSNCYTEGTSVRALNEKSTYSDSMTLEYCATFCDGYQYFGTEYSDECYCGNSFSDGSSVTNLEQCSMTCAGNDLEICGDVSRLSVYVNPDWSDSSSSTLSPTTSSTFSISTSSSVSSAASSETPISSSQTPSTSSDLLTTLSESSTTAIETLTPSSETSTASIEPSSSSAEAPTSSIEAPTSSIEAPISSVEASTSSVEAPTSSSGESSSAIEASASSSEVTSSSTATSTSSTDSQSSSSTIVSSSETPASSEAPTTSSEVPATSSDSSISSDVPAASTTSESPSSSVVSTSSDPLTVDILSIASGSSSLVSTTTEPSTSSVNVTAIAASLGIASGTASASISSRYSPSSTTRPSDLPGSGSMTWSNTTLTATLPISTSTFGSDSRIVSSMISSRVSSSIAPPPAASGSAISSGFSSSKPRQTVTAPINRTLSGSSTINTVLSTASSVLQTVTSPGSLSVSASSLVSVSLPSRSNASTTMSVASSRSVYASSYVMTTASSSASSSLNSSMTPPSSVSGSIVLPSATTHSEASLTQTASSIASNSPSFSVRTTTLLSTYTLLNYTSLLFPTTTSTALLGTTPIISSSFATSASASASASSSRSPSASSAIPSSNAGQSSLPSSSGEVSPSRPPSASSASSTAVLTSSAATTSTSSTGILTSSASTTSASSTESLTSSASTTSSASSSSSSSGVPSPLSPAFVPFGCFYDGVRRVFKVWNGSSTTQTPQNCATNCRAMGYRYSGTQWSSECWCSNEEPLHQALDSDCHMKCTGDPSATCGGGFKMNVVIDNKWTQKLFARQTHDTWALTGCFTDHVFHRTLRTQIWIPGGKSHATVANCLDACAAKKLRYCGAEYHSECFGSNTPPGSGMAAGIDALAAGCDMPCEGNSSEVCGGNNRIIVYENIDTNA